MTSVHSCRIESQRQGFGEETNFTGLPGKGRYSELRPSIACPKVGGERGGVDLVSFIAVVQGQAFDKGGVCAGPAVL